MITWSLALLIIPYIFTSPHLVSCIRSSKNLNTFWYLGSKMPSVFLADARSAILSMELKGGKSEEKEAMLQRETAQENKA